MPASPRGSVAKARRRLGESVASHVETSPDGQKCPQMGSRRREALHVYDSHVRIGTPFSQVPGN